ncbi:MAG: hypothetical protein EBZ61_09520 [Micrococcales bacterium]|nr:hypothetical protein [Micrococcales bacterium]
MAFPGWLVGKRFGFEVDDWGAELGHKGIVAPDEDHIVDRIRIHPVVPSPHRCAVAGQGVDGKSGAGVDEDLGVDIPAIIEGAAELNRGVALRIARGVQLVADPEHREEVIVPNHPGGNKSPLRATLTEQDTLAGGNDIKAMVIRIVVAPPALQIRTQPIGNKAGATEDVDSVRIGGGIIVTDEGAGDRGADLVERDMFPQDDGGADQVRAGRAGGVADAVGIEGDRPVVRDLGGDDIDVKAISRGGIGGGDFDVIGLTGLQKGTNGGGAGHGDHGAGFRTHASAH